MVGTFLCGLLANVLYTYIGGMYLGVSSQLNVLFLFKKKTCQFSKVIVPNYTPFNIFYGLTLVGLAILQLKVIWFVSNVCDGKYIQVKALCEHNFLLHLGKYLGCSGF